MYAAMEAPNPHCPPRGSLVGSTYLITGATSGLGQEAAAVLAAAGARVVFCVRSVGKARATAEWIRERVPEADLVVPPDPLPPCDFQDNNSVLRFAAAYEAWGGRITCLLNCAGAPRLPQGKTAQGVAPLAQANYLGAWVLVRALERRLAHDKARVVHVSSFTSRTCVLPRPTTFLTSWWHSWYKHTKLAQVLHAYEVQRQLGAAGVRACAVDPGGVNTAIWTNTVFSLPPIKQLISQLYAPASDGVAVLLHAATVPWEIDGAPGLTPGEDLRFYARGMFASPLLTHLDGAWASWAGTPWFAAWSAMALVHSLADYPLRRLSGGRLCGRVQLVRSSPHSYDRSLARDLWTASCDITGLTHPTAALTAGQTLIMAQLASRATLRSPPSTATGVEAVGAEAADAVPTTPGGATADQAAVTGRGKPSTPGVGKDVLGKVEGGDVGAGAADTRRLLRHVEGTGGTDVGDGGDKGALLCGDAAVAGMATGVPVTSSPVTSSHKGAATADPAASPPAHPVQGDSQGSRTSLSSLEGTPQRPQKYNEWQSKFEASGIKVTSPRITVGSPDGSGAVPSLRSLEQAGEHGGDEEGGMVVGEGGHIGSHLPPNEQPAAASAVWQAVPQSHMQEADDVATAASGGRAHATPLPQACTAAGQTDTHVASAWGSPESDSVRTAPLPGRQPTSPVPSAKMSALQAGVMDSPCSPFLSLPPTSRPGQLKHAAGPLLHSTAHTSGTADTHDAPTPFVSHPLSISGSPSPVTAVTPTPGAQPTGDESPAPGPKVPSVVARQLAGQLGPVGSGAAGATPGSPAQVLTLGGPASRAELADLSRQIAEKTGISDLTLARSMRATTAVSRTTASQASEQPPPTPTGMSASAPASTAATPAHPTGRPQSPHVSPPGSAPTHSSVVTAPPNKLSSPHLVAGAARFGRASGAAAGHAAYPSSPTAHHAPRSRRPPDAGTGAGTGAHVCDVRGGGEGGAGAGVEEAEGGVPVAPRNRPLGEGLAPTASNVAAMLSNNPDSTVTEAGAVVRPGTVSATATPTPATAAAPRAKGLVGKDEEEQMHKAEDEDVALMIESLVGAARPAQLLAPATHAPEACSTTAPGPVGSGRYGGRGASGHTQGGVAASTGRGSGAHEAGTGGSRGKGHGKKKKGKGHK